MTRKRIVGVGVLVLLSIVGVFGARYLEASTTSFMNAENFVSSTLQSGITALDTEITVAAADVADFPDAPFLLLIGSTEFVKVTSKAGAVFTVTRAQEGTSATVHSSGSSVRLVIAAGYLDEIQDAINAIEDGSNPVALDFDELGDTPADYVGHGDKLVAVKASEDGLEFQSAGDHDHTISDVTDLPTFSTTSVADAVPQADGTGELDTDWIPVLTGATSLLDGEVGLVPLPSAGDEGKYLKGDGTWSTTGAGTGDMETATYDTDTDNVVDNAEALGGVAAANYVQTTDTLAWTSVSKAGSSLADIELTPYSELTGRPADDLFAGLVSIPSPVIDDYLPIYDESLGAYYKITLGNVREAGTFTGLTDTPSTFTGHAGEFLNVNVGGTALQLQTVSEVLAALSLDTDDDVTFNTLTLTTSMDISGGYSGGSGTTISEMGDVSFNGTLVVDSSAEFGGGYGLTGLDIEADGDLKTDGDGIFEGSILSTERIQNPAISTDGLLAYYRMDDYSGLTDYSGNGVNAAMNGSMTSADEVDGKFGTALEFDGTDDYFNAGTSIPSAYGNSAFTVSAWFLTDTDANYLLGWTGASGERFSLHIGDVGTGGNVFAILGPSGDVDILQSTAGVDLSDNSWHNVTFVCEGAADTINKLYLYIDGAEVDSMVRDAGNASAAIDFEIGLFNTSHWTGRIDEIAVWGRGLSKQEVLALAMAKREMTAEGLALTSVSLDDIGVSDGEQLDLSAINASGTGEGLTLPQATDVSASTGEGQITWDTDDDTLYVGTGATAQAITGGGGGGGDLDDLTDVTAPDARTVTILSADWDNAAQGDPAPFFGLAQSVIISSDYARSGTKSARIYATSNTTRIAAAPLWVPDQEVSVSLWAYQEDIGAVQVTVTADDITGVNADQTIVSGTVLAADTWTELSGTFTPPSGAEGTWQIEVQADTAWASGSDLYIDDLEVTISATEPEQGSTIYYDQTSDAYLSTNGGVMGEISIEDVLPSGKRIGGPIAVSWADMENGDISEWTTPATAYLETSAYKYEGNYSVRYTSAGDTVLEFEYDGLGGGTSAILDDQGAIFASVVVKPGEDRYIWLEAERSGAHVILSYPVYCDDNSWTRIEGAAILPADTQWYGDINIRIMGSPSDTARYCAVDNLYAVRYVIQDSSTSVNTSWATEHPIISGVRPFDHGTLRPWSASASVFLGPENGASVFVGNDATPSLRTGGFLFKTGTDWTGTAVTGFDDKTPGHVFTVICQDTDFTMTDNDGTLELSGNWSPDSAGDTITLVSDGTNCYELNRSDN